MVADVAKLAVGRQDYYTREIANNHEEYLSGHGESPGRWYGQGAARLGQSGEASIEAFGRIFEGRHPDTGELLGRPHGRDAVPAFDVVLRPTKSVSILYALGDQRVGGAVLDAHHAGLAEAVAYLDGQLGARRGHGGAEHVVGNGVLAVGFDHRTSRAGDPLVHTHLVVANRVQGPDGRWTALDGRDLYRHRRAADAVYRAAYQRALTRSLGVVWTAADRYGNRELQGIPEELVRAFSKRVEQVTAEVERLEASGRSRTPRLVKWAVHSTRQAKQHEAPETLYGRWRAEAAERGTDAEALVRRVTGRARDHDQGLSERTVAGVFDRLAGPDGLTAQASTFAREDVLVALGAGLVGATGSELEGLADRLLAERAVSVVADRALEERRWSTPELLGVEERLVAAAVGRASERTGVASHEAVRQALAAHPSLGVDQAGMVRDVCLAGAGVQVVVGRPGTGKTYTLGAARHAWQLDGYRLLAAAPTGIATVSLEAEGFEEVATVDRLLLELDRSSERLDARTVLVVDEAGMVGSRKLTRLLEHAHRAQAKVVLVGDDRQLAAIDAGGGFRALRLRLGASELTENRRQLHAWERDAIELVRAGLVDEAVAAYREHGRVVAADSKQQMTLALLQDWWAAYRQAERDLAQDVVVLAARRDEADRLNTACQHVLATNGRLGAERLRVEDREVAVGDRVVCGKNAFRGLGIANGTRGVVTAMDVKSRTLTVRVEGPEAREVTLPSWYLDGHRPGERNRRIDLAYATTGHRAQGLTRWRALVRLTGREDANWLTVQLSRAKQETRLDATVGPQPQGPAELDVAEHDAPDVYLQFTNSLARDGSERLAIDTPSTPELRRLSTREVRAERDRLRAGLDQAPRDRARELARATARREQADQALAAARQQHTGRAAGMLRRWRGTQPAERRGALALAEQQADRAAEHERQLRAHQQRRAGWLEGNADLGPAYRQVVRELAWWRRIAAWPPSKNRRGSCVSCSARCRRRPGGSGRGRQAAAAIEEYRTTYNVQDPERALGREPRDPAERAAWRQARVVAERVRHKQRTAECPHTARDGRSERPRQLRSLPQPRDAGPERAAG